MQPKFKNNLLWLSIDHHYYNLWDTANQFTMTSVDKQLTYAEWQPLLKNSYGSKEGKAKVAELPI